jgi:hypothetical protein
MVNPTVVNHLASVSWADVRVVLQVFESTLKHLIDAAGGPRVVLEEALVMVQHVIRHPEQRPLTIVITDVARLIAEHSKPED